MKVIALVGNKGGAGKTTLARALAEHYETVWTPEYVREFVRSRGAAPTVDDVEAIARGQMALEGLGVGVRGEVAVSLRPPAPRRGEPADHLASGLLGTEDRIAVLKVTKGDPFKGDRATNRGQLLRVGLFDDLGPGIQDLEDSLRRAGLCRACRGSEVCRRSAVRSWNRHAVRLVQLQGRRAQPRFVPRPGQLAYGAQ